MQHFFSTASLTDQSYTEPISLRHSVIWIQLYRVLLAAKTSYMLFCKQVRLSKTFMHIHVYNDTSTAWVTVLGRSADVLPHFWLKNYEALCVKILFG